MSDSHGEAERWAEVRRHFDELCTLGPAPRSARLDAIAAIDPRLREALDALLAADEHAEQRLAGVEAVLRPHGAAAGGAQAGLDLLDLVGHTVAHFLVVQPLGAGGMGVVYRAQDIRLERPVALKFPLPGRPLDPHAREQFLREARAAAALDHPNLCSIYDTGETADGHLFLAMALYEGETLQARLQRAGPFPIPAALAIAAQIVSGISAAHRAGIVHRDLKPANVMLLPDGTAKVLDFGLASTMLNVTGTRALLGTVSYMAPEQLRGEATDERADLWAIGVLLYEMVTGCRPFTGAHDVAIAHAIVNAEPTLPTALRPDLDAATERLILGLLTKDAARRPRSAADVASMLSLPPQPSRGRLDHFPRATKAHRYGLLATVAVLLVLAVSVPFVRARSPAASESPRVRDAAVMVLPFRTASDSSNSGLAEMMADLLSLRLNGEAGPEAIDMRSTLRALRAAGNPPARDLTPAAALEIARAAGAAHVLLGEVIETPGRIVMSASWHGPGSHRTATVAGARDSLLPLADRLVVQLLSGAAGEHAQRLEGLTRFSLPAVRAYLIGQAAYRRGEFERSVESFRTALDHDSTFALAALGLELAMGWGEPDVAQTWARRLAIRYRDRMPARDRALVEVLYMDTGVPPHAQRRRLELYTERYPDRPEGWVGLGENYYHSGGDTGTGGLDDLALVAFDRAIALDRHHPAAYIHVLDILAFRADTGTLRRRTQELRSILSASSAAASAATPSLWLAAMVLGDEAELARIRSRMDVLPGHALTFFSLYAMRSAVDPADGERALHLAEQLAPTADRRADVRYLRAVLYLNTGRDGQARRALREYGLSLGEPRLSRVELTRLAHPGADTTGTGMLIEQLAARVIAASPLEEARSHCLLGLLAHRRGETPAAAHIAALARGIAADSALAQLRLCQHALEAAAAHREDAPNAAARMATLDAMLENTPPVAAGWTTQWPRYVAVQLHRERGELEAALHAVNGMCGGCFLHAPAVLERARLQALLGERDASIHNYRHYLRLMAHPDPGPVAAQALAARRELLELLPR